MSFNSALILLTSMLAAGAANAQSQRAEPVTDAEIVAEIPAGDPRLAKIEAISRGNTCATKLAAANANEEIIDFKDARATLQKVIQIAPRIMTEAQLDATSWWDLAQTMALPSVDELSPGVFMVVYGDPNTGKSTFVNRCVAMMSNRPNIGEFEDVVPVGLESGKTKRVTVVTSSGVARGRGNVGPMIQQDIVVRYKNPKTVDVDSRLAEPGAPVIKVAPALDDEETIVLVDAPDMSSGPIDAESAQYAEAVQASIMPADVMVVMLNKSNYNRQSFKRSIRDAFKTIGPRSMIIVWQGNAEGTEHTVLGFIRSFAEEVYDTMSGPTGLPKGVLGAFWTTQDDLDVSNRRKFAEYTPFPGFKTLPELMQHIREKSREVKEFSIQHVLRRIQTDLREMLRVQARQIHAAEVWGRAIDAGIATLAQRFQERVPYERIRTPVRDRFFDLHSEGITRMVHKVVYRFIHLWRDTVGTYRLSKADQIMVAADKTENFENKMTLFQTSFRNGVVNLIRTSPKEDPTNSAVAGAEVRAVAEKFRHMYPAVSEPPRAGILPADGQVPVELPPVADLSPGAQAAVAKFLTMDPRLIAAQLQAKLSEYITMDVDAIIRNDHHVMNALREKVGGKVIGTQWFLDWTTATFLIGGVWEIFQGGFQMAVGVGMIGAAKLVYDALDDKREKNIATALSQYFGRKQFETARDYLTQQLQDVRNALSVADLDHLNALHDIQEALAISDKNAPKFTPTIEAAPDPRSNVPTVNARGPQMFKRDYPIWRKPRRSP